MAERAKKSSSVFELWCHHCSHNVGVAAVVMESVATFKPSRVGRVEPAHTNEVRKRCSHCGWVNVFIPAVPASRDVHAVEVKTG